MVLKHIDEMFKFSSRKIVGSDLYVGTVNGKCVNTNAFKNRADAVDAAKKYAEKHYTTV